MDDTLFEVKPTLTLTPDNQGTHSLTIDSGSEDKNRIIQIAQSVSGSLSVTVSLKSLDDAENHADKAQAGTAFYECRITLKDKDVTVFEHTAKYTVVSPVGEPAITFEEVEEEARTGWFNAMTSALFQQQSADSQVGANPVSEVNAMHKPESSMPASQSVQVVQASAGEQVYVVNGKPIPTSWLVIAASTIAFAFGMVIVFVAQSLMNTANATTSSATKAQSSYSEPVATVSHIAEADSSSALGINPQTFADVQKQTVTDMLKEMGIDPTHNQQDLSCLVE